MLMVPLAVWIVAALAAAAPGSAPLQCGSWIVEDTVLTADLGYCPGSGLVIRADGVVLDLAGHTISGVGEGFGIDNSAGFDGVRILDGNVERFAVGVRLDVASGNVIRRVSATGATFAAMWLSGSDDNLVVVSWASSPGGTGVCLIAARTRTSSAGARRSRAAAGLSRPVTPSAMRSYGIT